MVKLAVVVVPHSLRAPRHKNFGVTISPSAILFLCACTRRILRLLPVLLQASYGLSFSSPLIMNDIISTFFSTAATTSTAANTTLPFGQPAPANERKVQLFSLLQLHSSTDVPSLDKCTFSLFLPAHRTHKVLKVITHAYRYLSLHYIASFSHLLPTLTDCEFHCVRIFFQR